MLAIKAIGTQLYGWEREAQALAKPASLVNLDLIATGPAQLAQMAKAKRDGQWDVSATECNGLSAGPSGIAAQQPRAATHGRPIPEKEAPSLPVKQPVQPRRETTAEPPPPLSPQQRRRQELEELARVRAHWCGWR